MRKPLQSFLWALGCMLLLVGLQWWVWPAVAEAVKDYTTAQREQERAAVLSQQAAQLTALLEAQREALVQVADVVPTTDLLPFVVTKFEQEAATLGLRVRIKEIFEPMVASPSPTTQQDAARAVIVRVQATGTASNLLTWLDQLEHGIQLTSVPRWSLRAMGSQTGAGEALYEMELDVELYIRGTVRLEQVQGLLTTE